MKLPRLCIRWSGCAHRISTNLAHTADFGTKLHDKAPVNNEVSRG